VAESTDQDCLFALERGVATITLNRPAQRNAFGGALPTLLRTHLQRCDDDDAVRAVVITGTPPAFCSGADLSAGGQTFAKAEASTFSANPFNPPLWEVRKPIIAAVNGHAIGVGFTLTLQCDIRIMAADAKYGIVQARRGVMGDAISHWTIARIAGLANAADVLFTGRMFNGEEAKEMGIANRVLPADEVLPAAQALATDIAVNSAPLSVAASKRLLWSGVERGPAYVERIETEYHNHLMGHHDSREGVMAFLEEREPRWQGSVSREFSTWSVMDD
jgi:enoyl-CoA hydratase/carnithine racemase